MYEVSAAAVPQARRTAHVIILYFVVNFFPVVVKLVPTTDSMFMWLRSYMVVAWTKYIWKNCNYQFHILTSWHRENDKGTQIVFEPDNTQATRKRNIRTT